MCTVNIVQKGTLMKQPCYLSIFRFGRTETKKELRALVVNVIFYIILLFCEEK